MGRVEGWKAEGVKWGLDDAVTVLVKQHSQVPLIHLNQEQNKSEPIRTTAKLNKLTLGRKWLLRFTGWAGSTCALSFFLLSPPLFVFQSPFLQSADQLSDREKERVWDGRPCPPVPRACGFGPGTGIPCTDTESAGGDRRACSTEEHFVHCHQGKLTQQTHTTMEIWIF